MRRGEGWGWLVLALLWSVVLVRELGPTVAPWVRAWLLASGSQP